MAPLFMLSGQNVTVRPFAESDMPVVRRWQNIPGPGPAFMGNILPRPLSGTFELFRVSWAKNMIVEASDGPTPIGVVRIAHVRMEDRHAALFYEVGEKAYLNQPHAEEGLRLVIRYLFDQKLTRIYTYAMDYEPVVIALLEKTGFRREVILKDRLYYAGGFHPVYVYGLLAGEFK